MKLLMNKIKLNNQKCRKVLKVLEDSQNVLENQYRISRKDYM